MSRIGNKPIAIPAGVNVEVSGQKVAVSGKKGKAEMVLVGDLLAKVDKGVVSVAPKQDTKRARMMWGMSRTLINNMINGAVNGYTVDLEINGVGYRAAVAGKTLNLQLGFSHEIAHAIPAGIEIKCEKPTTIRVSGADKHLVGQVAAEIRAYRGPEPYKGKGIKYADEVIHRKEGKKK